MKRFSGKIPIIAAAVLLTLVITVLGCVSAVSASSSRRASNAQTALISADSADKNTSYAGWLNNRIQQASHNRVKWLGELLKATGHEVTGRGDDILRQAYDLGWIPAYSMTDMYMPLSRRYVGYTMTRALDYPESYAGYIADITKDESYMSTMAYLGYFIPDINNEIHPGATITSEEFDALCGELDRYSRLKGKSILSFGDSIMYGSGNGGEGISDMIAVKYGMLCTDYAIPGATFGICDEKEHIPDQIRKAYAAHKTADIILINGGTNDVNHTALGEMKSGFDMSRRSEKELSGAFERSLWLLRTYWRNTPVIYIRAHNMELGDDKKEKIYGDRCMEIAEKWSVRAVDLYNDSGLNTEDASMRSRYTYLNPYTGYTCDAIHPNAIGYAKYYLPLITKAADAELTEEAR